MVFNNGTNRPGGAYSSIEELVPPLIPDGSYLMNANTAFGPAATTWTYASTPHASFYSLNIGGATRLPNGNTLICEGANGKFFEVTSAGEIVWTYVNPVAGTGILMQGQTSSDIPVFKIYRYAPEYPALAGKTLTALGTIETYPTEVKHEDAAPVRLSLNQNYPNPFSGITTIPFTISQRCRVVLTVQDALGREIATLVDEDMAPGTYAAPFDAHAYPGGVLFYVMRENGVVQNKRMMVTR
jgi:hypothetical protein